LAPLCPTLLGTFQSALALIYKIEMVILQFEEQTQHATLEFVLYIQMIANNAHKVVLHT
jgi:hypothetical protein